MISAFLSYCRSDIVDYPYLTVFCKEKIEELGYDSCEVILDEADPDLTGSRLSEFEARVSTVDVAIFLIGLDFANSIETRSARHCVRELELALERHSQDLLIIPIILSAGLTKMFPNKLRDLVSVDFSFMSAAADRITLERKLSTKLDQIWHRIIRHPPLRFSANTRTEQRAIDFLFTDSAADFWESKNRPFVDRLMVLTYFAARISINTGFLVGRKGVGKSAITQILPQITSPRPKSVLRFSFDQLEWGRLVRLVESRREDDKIFGKTEYLRRVWESFFLFMIALHQRNQLSEIDVIRSPLFNTTKNCDWTDALKLAFTQILTTAGSLAADVRETISAEIFPLVGSRLAIATLGEGVLKWVLTYIAKFKSNEICIVGDDFNIAVSVPEERLAARHYAEAEKNIIISLAEFITSDHRDKKSIIPKSSCRFLVAVPNDRMLLIKSSLRDGIKARICNLYWTGIELSSLIRKRLAALALIRDFEFEFSDAAKLREQLRFQNWSRVDPKNPNEARNGLRLLDRFDKVSGKLLPELPGKIEFMFNDQHVSMSIFSYILRHTLWRPRDMLYYYSALCAEALNARKRSENITIEQVRTLIALRTKTLVELEVIGEYREFHPRIEDALKQFRGANQVFKCDAFSKLATKTSTISRYDGGKHDQIEPNERLERAYRLFVELFELGLVGFMPADVEKRVILGRQWVFSFQKYLDYSLPAKHIFERADLCFHPMLKEYLGLDTTNNQFVLLYTPEWLSEQDRWVENSVSLIDDFEQPPND
jgi:hypothetical protein